MKVFSKTICRLGAMAMVVAMAPVFVLARLSSGDGAVGFRVRALSSNGGVATVSSSSSTANAVSRAEQAAALWKWLASKGVVSDDSAAVRVGEGGQGLGLYARRGVSKGQEIVSVPKSVWIDAEVVRESEIGEFCEGLKPWVAVALFLIHEKAKPDSRWRAYIDVLPESLESPLFWSDEELAELKGTQLLGSVVGYKQFLEREYVKVMEEVIKPRPDVFDLSLYSLGAFTWVFGILRSRTFPPLVGDNLALVPLADLINHGTALTNEDLSWERKSAGVFSRQEVLTVRAAANYRENEEVAMQYGKKKGNGNLALDYGFVEYGGANNRDIFTLSLQISPSDRFADDKTDVAELNGLSGTVYFDIVKDEGPPEAMLAFLRLTALAGTDSFLLEALFRNSVWDHLQLPVSRDNEEAICEAMVDGCRATLAEYTSTIEENTRLLEEGTLSPRKKIAVVVRLGERGVLQDLKRWFEAHLADLDKLEYYAERRLRDLGLLDGKGNMTPWASRG